MIQIYQKTFNSLQDLNTFLSTYESLDLDVVNIVPILFKYEVYFKIRIEDIEDDVVEYTNKFLSTIGLDCK